MCLYNILGLNWDNKITRDLIYDTRHQAARYYKRSVPRPVYLLPYSLDDIKKAVQILDIARQYQLVTSSQSGSSPADLLEIRLYYLSLYRSDPDK